MTDQFEVAGGLQEDDFKQAGYNDRLGFIRKVYGILSVQLLMTIAMCTCSVMSKQFSDFQIQNLGLFWFMVATSFISCIILTCFRGVARAVPANYILLGVFTFAESWLVSTVCGLYDRDIVIMAAVLTAGVVIALTVYACTTKTDFTMLGGMLFVCLCLSILVGFFLMFSNNNAAHIVYCALGCVLFGIYLIFDTQLILGGGRYELGYDEYIFAAMNLYLDIIILFLKILELLARSKN